MNNTVIKKITEQSTGIYVIEIDKEKALAVSGQTYIEKVNNAIDKFESMYVVEEGGKKPKVEQPQKKSRIVTRR